jgi:hypothetical protein
MLDGAMHLFLGVYVFGGLHTVCLAHVLQLRHVMDPKRHFKRSGKSKALPKFFQVSDQIASFVKYFRYVTVENL